MRSAEWVLSLVMPPERARAVAGDFLEEAEERGGFWFWRSVVRTALAVTASGFAEHPAAVLRAGTFGYLRCVALLLVTAPLVQVVMVSRIFAPPVDSALPFVKWPLEALWMVWLFFCGQWAARRAPGAEFAAGITVALIGWIPIVAWLAAVWKLSTLPAFVIVFSPHDMALLAGALWERRRVVKRQAA